MLETRRMPKFSCVILVVATVVNIQGRAGAWEECSSGTKTLDVTTESQYIVSENYPNKYPNTRVIECTRRLSAPSGSRIVVFIRNLDLENSFTCNRDYIEFTEDTRTIARMCEKGTPSVFSEGSTLNVRFKTDSSVAGTGFRLEYRILRADDKFDCPPEGSPPLQATDSDNTLRSPGYPNEYSSHLDCYWTLVALDNSKVIQITVDNSNLESGCSYDSVTAYDGRSPSSDRELRKWCGDDKPTFHSSYGALLLHFRTDGSSNYKGFSLRFRQVSHDEAISTPGFCPREPNPISINDEYTELTSPNYPAGYESNQNCVWLLKAGEGLVVELVVRDSRLESDCDYDYVSVHDGDSRSSKLLGKFCGGETPTYYSSGRYLIVNFQSDGSREYKGFRMEYRQLKREDVPKNIGVEVILPSVVASIAAAALCCYCCKRCCCNDKDDDDTTAGDTPQPLASPHAVYTHPTVTWTSGGTAVSGGTPYPAQPNVYADAPPYPAQPTYTAQQPQQPPVDGYSATNGSNPPPSGFSSPLRPPSPYHSVEGGRASPLMPSAPPPPPSAPTLRVMEEPPPAYDSLRFDDMTGAPLLHSSAQEGAEGEEESTPLYDRKC